MFIENDFHKYATEREEEKHFSVKNVLSFWKIGLPSYINSGQTKSYSCFPLIIACKLYNATIQVSSFFEMFLPTSVTYTKKVKNKK